MVKKENLSNGEMGGWGGGGKKMLDDSSFVCLTLVALNREQIIFSTEYELALPAPLLNFLAGIACNQGHLAWFAY